MSKKSVRSSSRTGSVKSGGKAPGGKKPEPCSQCTKPNKNLRLLACSHAFCPECLKTLPTKEVESNEKDGRSSKLSNKGGKKSATPKEEPICPICDAPKQEEDFTHGECAPCKFEEKSSGATGFCVECSELLCESCSTEHNKFKTIRAHNILKGDRIPKDTGAVARLPLLMMCMVHTEKDLEYYCADHDVMGCGACVNTDHRRCERVMFIKDITDEPSDRKVVADAAVELRDIKKNFEDIHKDTGEILTSLEQQRNEIRERREQYKNKIMELLDKLETSSEIEMEEVIQNVSKDMGDDSQSSTEILGKLDSSIQILDAAAGHATNQQMFVAGRRSAAERDKYVNMLNNAMGSIQNVRLEFKPDPTMERLAKSLEMFDGRTISSNRTRQNQKPRNTFQPQNGFIDHGMGTQPVNFISRTDMNRRPSSEFSNSNSQFQNNRGNDLPPIGRQTSIMTGSVPDFRSAGYRSSMTDFQGGGGGGIRSLPQTPRRNDFNQQFRSMPPTPRLGMTDGLEPTLYERQMFNQGALPIIPPRVAYSEPGFDMGRKQQDFAPLSPRTVGNNALVNQGLNKPQMSKPDMLTINHQQVSRRNSLTSIASMPLSTRETSTKTKSDILAQASPINRRGELNPSGPALKDRKAILAGQFNVRLQEDSNVCGLKGAAFMQDGRIVLADYDNHNVKVFDSKLYRGSQLRLSSGPWDVEVTGPKEVAVSLPFESKIQFIAVTDQLKATRSIKLDMDCYGIVCRNQELIVVCNDYLIGPAVQVVSLTGRIKQTIDTDRSGRRILSDPYYLTVTPTGKLIYVSDKDRIVCMDRHGNVTSVYQDVSLRNARGIDIDNEGNLYVCGYMSNSVHQITMHGIDFRCLISKEQVWDPWSVKFSEGNGTIMVTCDASDTIKVFSLQ
ncbi:uncharacterized protein LOC123548962 [Mercenaria mercenaria]|uniref:uncharacterized protein LOC123548962 n=1 Tax=Mercenaria mercenaria TaxID=6596 RepID=UPI00234F9BCD|nr:uncharacterized protein LOC123548962 [Mercenaria mercenaria]